MQNQQEEATAPLNLSHLELDILVEGLKALGPPPPQIMLPFLGLIQKVTAAHNHVAGTAHSEPDGKSRGVEH